MEGKVQVEAHGFGTVSERLEPGESPQAAADRLGPGRGSSTPACQPDQWQTLPTQGPDTPPLERLQDPTCCRQRPWQRPESIAEPPSEQQPRPPQRKALQKRAPRSLDCNHANPSEFMVVSSRSIRRCWDRRRDRRSPVSQAPVQVATGLEAHAMGLGGDFVCPCRPPVIGHDSETTRLRSPRVADELARTGH